MAKLNVTNGDWSHRKERGKERLAFKNGGETWTSGFEIGWRW